MASNEPPEEVKSAAAIVDRWLKNQPNVLDAGNSPQPRPLTAAERFKRMPRNDTPAPMPAWDPNRKD
jgi:hypothetical protein